MTCEVCYEEMKPLCGDPPSDHLSWCPRCGTLILIGGDVLRPKWMTWPATVERVAVLKDIQLGAKRR